jgi:hypothetical protein
LKKTGNNQRPPSSGNNQRRNASNSPRNNQNRNNNTSSRNTAQGKRPHTPHLWASAASSSTTLTSHLSMVNRRNQDGGSRKNNVNGEARPNGKPRARSNQNLNDKNQNNSQGRVQRNYRNNKSSTAHHKSPSNGLRGTTSNSTQKNVTKSNKVLESKTNTFGIDPFELFCAYHLGITSNNQYRLSNINEVANRFKVDTGTTRQILKEYGMDSAALLDRDFDMALAQLDIQVAPEGINRTELGRNIFEEFLESPIKKRDWGKIIEEDKKENEKTFGRK